MNVPMAKKVITHERNIINVCSLMFFFLNLGVMLKKDYGRGRRIPFSQNSTSVGKEDLFGTVPNE